MKLQKSKTIYVDIDGTICENRDDLKQEDIDTPVNYENVKSFPERIRAINELFDEGHTIVYWTARGSRTGIDWTELTQRQLKEWGAKHTELKLGKPDYDLFICDKAINTRDYFVSQ